MTVIVLSVVVTVFGSFGKAQRGIGQTMNQQLWFCTPADFVASNENPARIAGQRGTVARHHAHFRAPVSAPYRVQHDLVLSVWSTH